MGSASGGAGAGHVHLRAAHSAGVSVGVGAGKGKGNAGLGIGAGIGIGAGSGHGTIGLGIGAGNGNGTAGFGIGAGTGNGNAGVSVGIGIGPGNGNGNSGGAGGGDANATQSGNAGGTAGGAGPARGGAGDRTKAGVAGSGTVAGGSAETSASTASTTATSEGVATGLGAANNSAAAAIALNSWLQMGQAPAGFRALALKAFSSAPYPGPNSSDGFYKGSGVLAVADRRCSPQELALVTLKHNQAFFDGVSTGVVAGATASGTQVSLVNVRHGSKRLVGTFGDATFEGTLSDAGCVYNYTLPRVARPERVATSAPTPPRVPATGSQPVQGPHVVARQDEPAVERATARTLPKEALPDSLAERQARLGDRSLAEGKITEAREFFKRAALAGNPRGALGLGMTYDPTVLATIDSKGIEADLLVAKVWYRRAELSGDKDAESMLARLDAGKPSNYSADSSR